MLFCIILIGFCFCIFYKDSYSLLYFLVFNKISFSMLRSKALVYLANGRGGVEGLRPWAEHTNSQHPVHLAEAGSFTV